MPTYEYRCRDCGNEFELRQGFDSAPTIDCPSCGHVATRLISSVPVIFKGTGWYVTDYGRGRSGPQNNGREKEEASESKEISTSETSKPESPKDSGSSTPVEDTKGGDR